jgi:hypothetical protein
MNYPQKLWIFFFNFHTKTFFVQYIIQKSSYYGWFKWVCFYLNISVYLQLYLALILRSLLPTIYRTGRVNEKHRKQKIQNCFIFSNKIVKHINNFLKTLLLGTHVDNTEKFTSKFKSSLVHISQLNNLNQLCDK